MILLADGGSTKVEWCLADEGKLIEKVITKGMNPYYRTGGEIGEEISGELLPVIKNNSIDAIYFYGAGCAFPDKIEIVRNALRSNFTSSFIGIESDLLGAARALSQNMPGIICIMGTGSNSCYYDGEKIIQNVSPLGYILGDEGSGAVLGRLFVSACLKNQLGEDIKEKFLTYYQLTISDILEKVYKQPMGNRFLAGFSPFIREHIKEKNIYNIVYNSFKDFFYKNIMQYDYKNNPIYFTGSVAFYYRDILKEVADELGLNIGTIYQSPMEGLIKYHS